MKLPKGHTATVTQNYFFFGPSHSVAWEGLLRPWIRLLLQSHTEKGFIILPIISVGAEMKLARRRHTKLSYYAYCYTLFLWSFAQLRDESMHILFVCIEVKSTVLLTSCIIDLLVGCSSFKIIVLNWLNNCQYKFKLSSTISSTHDFRTPTEYSDYRSLINLSVLVLPPGKKHKDTKENFFSLS